MIGLAMGVGVWNRVNFAWLLGSALIASVIVFRKRILIPIRHVAALICGGLIGVFPMLLFQFLSNWVILEFINGSQSQESFGPILIRRIGMLSEIGWRATRNMEWTTGSPLASLLFLHFIVVCSDHMLHAQTS
jgi:hypothetical protein